MSSLSLVHNCVLLVVSFLISLAASQTNGYDANWFIPDIVTKKPDPFNLISSNFGQTAGEYNWNADQYALMGRNRTKCNGCTQNGKHVAVQDLKLYVNDEEYFVKAVCYHPVPLGVKSEDSSSGTGGGGLCSPRYSGFGNNATLSACGDSDFFDGWNVPGRVPPAPGNGWFKGVWERDFPVIKELGANTLRMYHTSPITTLYTEAVANGEQEPIENLVGIVLEKDHRPFMDLAYQYGLMVIFPLDGDENTLRNVPTDTMHRLLMNQIDEIGNHPALLMYTLGNELPLNDPVIVNLVNQYMAFSRNYSLIKWGRSIPISLAVVDDPFTYNELYDILDVDVFTTNAGYRGLGFQDLWDGSQTPGFAGLGTLSRNYSKPNFIGEIGWEQINGSQTADPAYSGWFNQKWRDLILKGTTSGCVGGAFFEYMDEPLTKVDPGQQTMGTVAPRVSSMSDFPSTTGSPSDTYQIATYPPYESTSDGSTAHNNLATNTPSTAHSNDGISLTGVSIPSLLAVIALTLYIGKYVV